MSANLPKCDRCGDHHQPQQPTCQRYNGWSNYETWCVNLWLSNEEPSYRHWEHAADDQLEQVAEGRELGTLSPSYSSQTIKQQATCDLAERLKEEHEEAVEERLGFHMDKASRPAPSFVDDLLSAALSEVNWYEIAEHLIEAAQERARA